jgi:OOP family OmpA-OmpF porin
MTVWFGPRAATLDSSADVVLDRAAMTLRADPHAQVDIEGHTDHLEAVGLGQIRAEAVRVELLQRGVPPNQIVTTSAGSSKPLAPNVTEQGRAQNRRAEIHVH